MISGVNISRDYPDGSARLVVIGDSETIKGIAEDLTSRMLGQPSEVEPDAQDEAAGDWKALSIADLEAAREGATVWAGGFADRRRNARVRWRKMRDGRWDCGGATVRGRRGVTGAWLSNWRGPVTLDAPPPEAARKDESPDPPNVLDGSQHDE